MRKKPRAAPKRRRQPPGPSLADAATAVLDGSRADLPRSYSGGGGRSTLPSSGSEAGAQGDSWIESGLNPGSGLPTNTPLVPGATDEPDCCASVAVGTEV